MQTKFDNAEQVENFLSEEGVLFHKGYSKVPVKNTEVPYWQVKVGKSYCEVYDIVQWANVVYSLKATRFRKG